MNDFKKKMLKLFLSHPLDFNLYLDGYKNKSYAYKVIRSFIPTDTGIEMEIGNPLVMYIEYVKNKYQKAYPNIVIDSEFEINFRLRNSNMKRDLDELNRFYNMITKSYLLNRRSDNCGIHIHTNLTTKFYYKKLMYNQDINSVVEFIERYFKYTGTYNDSKFSTHKGNSVIYRGDYGTLEYRCIPMTWNFSELLKYIIFCHAMTRGFQMYSKGQCGINELRDIYDSWISILNTI